MKPPKMTRTARYFFDRSEKHGFDGYTWRPRMIPRSGYMQVQGLGFVQSQKVEYDLPVLYRDITENRDHALFFCDNGAFDDDTPRTLIDGLLNEPGKLVLTPLVRQELAPWLSRRPEHPLAQAVSSHHPGITFLDSTAELDWQEFAAEYYIHLLGARKYLYYWEQNKFARLHGRPPDKGELEELRRNLQKPLGERGYRIVSRAFDGHLGPTFLTDEQVVYEAVATAIITGRPAVILARDEDLEEQFFKLTWLMGMHYRGMLLAAYYAGHIPEFTVHAMPEQNPHLRQLFRGENNILVERSETILEQILPPAHSPVSIDCLTLGKGCAARMKFMAERQMAELLRVKGETRGLNTAALGGRNCHVWLAPVNLPNALSGCAAIAYDQRTPMGGVQVPLLDIWQAINTVEHFRQVLLL